MYTPYQPSPLRSSSYDQSYALSLSMPAMPVDGTTALPQPTQNTSASPPEAYVGALTVESFRDVFLATTRDTHEHLLSAVWYMSPIALSMVAEGDIIVNQYSPTARSFGSIMNLIAQDETHSLYRLRIEGWATQQGALKPPCDTFAFLLAPKRHTYSEGPMAAQPGGTPVVPLGNSHMRYRLVDRIHDIASEVRDVAEYADPKILLGPDSVTNAFALTYSNCPIMRFFSPDKDAGVAVHENDLSLTIQHYFWTPTPNFNFEVQESDSTHNVHTEYNAAAI